MLQFIFLIAIFFTFHYIYYKFLVWMMDGIWNFMLHVQHLKDSGLIKQS